MHNIDDIYRLDGATNALVELQRWQRFCVCIFDHVVSVAAHAHERAHMFDWHTRRRQARVQRREELSRCLLYQPRDMQQAVRRVVEWLKRRNWNDMVPTRGVPCARII